MNKKERYKFLIRYMISIGIAPNQKELGAKLGYTSESAFSQIINGKKSKPENFTTRLRTLLPSLNLSWLLTGEGEMLLSSEKSQNAHEIGGVFSAGQKDDGVLMVDYIPTSASATFVESLASGSDVWDEKMPLIPSGNERNEIDELRVFEVEGDSMSPTIISGSLILTKEIPERSWHYAEGVVVAVFAEFVVVKRVAINRLLTDNFLTLSSDNESYGQMTVPLSDIRGLFKAKRIISSPIR
jgi:phage repressor protein C with HTH and peptisase S24 domain